MKWEGRYKNDFKPSISQMAGTLNCGSQAIDKRMASRMLNPKLNKQLEMGRCHVCGSYHEALIPATMDLCKKCVDRFHNRTGKLRLLQVKPLYLHPSTCVWCGNVVSKIYVVNPDLCQKCMMHLR